MGLFKRMGFKKLFLIIMLIILSILPVLNDSGYIINMFILILLYAYWANSWNIIGGFGGQLSLGHAAYIGLGAYVAVIMYLFEGISPWIGMIVGGVIAGLFSLIIGVACFRLKGSYYTLSTIALLFVLRIFITTQPTIFGYETDAALGLKINWAGESFWGLQFVSKIPYYYIILVLFVLSVIVAAYINKSKMGYYLAAINTNQIAADSLGVNVMGYKLTAGFISAFMSAVGGAFYAFFLAIVDPVTIFGYDLSAKIVLLAIVGGRGTVWGPVLGACILTPLNEILRSQLGAHLAGISFVIYGLVMMLVIMFMPGGLISLKDIVNKIYLKIKRKVKIKEEN